MNLESPWSAPDYANWAADVIAVRGLGGSALIGHSYSGMVAVTLAAVHPDVVGPLIVSDTPGFGEPVSLAQGVGGAIFDAALDWALVLRLWPHVASNAITHRANFVSMIRESLTADLRELARRVSAPSLVTWGGRSRLMHSSVVQTLAVSLSRSQVYVSAHGAHTWVVSRREEFALAVASFLTSVKR